MLGDFPSRTKLMSIVFFEDVSSPNSSNVDPGLINPSLSIGGAPVPGGSQTP